MRGRNLKKFMDAINLLSQPCGTTIPELGKRLEIDKRQVYRVLETMQDRFMFVILKDTDIVGSEVRYSLEKGQFKRLSNMNVADLNLTLSEIIALHFLKSHAALYTGTDIEKEIERAFAKLDVFVPSEFGKRLDKIKTIFLPSSKFFKDYSKKEKIIENLTNGMLEQRTCLVKYHSFMDDEIKFFKIDPLNFFEHEGGLYIFARTTSFGDIRMLAVERIKTLSITDKPFDYPDDFEPEDLLEGAFGLHCDDPVRVKIRFSANQAPYIGERKWARNQKITKCNGGLVILEMETSGWWDVKKWVLSFGDDAEVLEPAELRDELLEEARMLVNKYAGGGPKGASARRHEGDGAAFVAEE